MSQSCLADLVIAEELEIIICGSTVSGREQDVSNMVVRVSCRVCAYYF